MKMITLKNRGIKEIVIEEILENHREERKVVELDLSYNHLSKLKGIEKFVVLVKLDISYNRVKRLIDLPPTIRILRAHHNILNSIVGISNLKQLEELDVSHNRMSTLKGIYNNRKLKILNASHNRILTCDGMETLRSLEELDLSYNNVSDFLDTRPLRFLKKLHSLWIVGNPVYKHHPREYYLFMCQQITKSLRTLDGKKMVSIPPVTPQLEGGYKQKRKPKIPKFGKNKKKKKKKSTKKRLASGKKKRKKRKKEDRTAEEMLEGILQYSPEFVKKNLFLDGSQYRDENDDDDDISDSDDEVEEEEERYKSIHKSRRKGNGEEVIEDDLSSDEDSDEDEHEDAPDSQRARRKKKKITQMENENEILNNIVSTLRKSVDDEHRTKIAKKSGVKRSSNNIFEIFPYISPKSKKNDLEEDDSDDSENDDDDEEDEEKINREDEELDRFDLEEMGGPSKKSVREQIDTFQEILQGRKRHIPPGNNKNKNNSAEGLEDEHSIISQLMDEDHPPYPYQPIEHVDIQPRESGGGGGGGGGMNLVRDDGKRRKVGGSPSSSVGSTSNSGRHSSNVNTPQVDYRYGVGSGRRGPPSTTSLSSSVSHPSSHHHHQHPFSAHPSSGGIRRGGPKLFPPNQPTPPIFQRAFDYETTQKTTDPLFTATRGGVPGSRSQHVSPNENVSPSTVGSISSYYQSLAPTEMSGRPQPAQQTNNIRSRHVEEEDEEDDNNYLPHPPPSSGGGGVMWDGQGGVRPVVVDSLVGGEYPGGSGSYGGPSLEKFDKLYEEYHKMLKQNQSLQTKTEYLINLLEVEKESSTVMKKLLGSKEKEIEQLKQELDKQRRTSLRKKKRIMMSYNRMEKRKLSVESDNDDLQKTIETLKEQLRRAMDRIKRNDESMIVINKYINKLESTSGVMDEEERKERIQNISLFEKVHRVLEPFKKRNTSNSTSSSFVGPKGGKSSLAEFAKTYQKAGRLASAGSSWASTLRKK